MVHQVTIIEIKCLMQVIVGGATGSGMIELQVKKTQQSTAASGAIQNGVVLVLELSAFVGWINMTGVWNIDRSGQ